MHCHYDKRSKGIISAIGSLEKQLILPNFFKICTFNFCDYSIYRHTSVHVTMKLIYEESFVDLATLAIKVKHYSGSVIGVAIQTV